MAYSGTDPYVVLADATSMLDEVYEMDPVVQQNRFGATAQHIRKTTAWKGGALHKKFINQIYTGVRADSDLEADAPDATKINTTDIQIEESHLRKLGFALSYSIPANMEVDGSSDAVWNLAKELALQANEAVGEKRNQLLNSDANCVKASVAAVYNEDGTTYTSGQTDALLQLSGSPSMFHMGEHIDIRTGSTTTVRLTAVVNDVVHDTYIFGRNVGPGIVVTRLSGTDTDFDNVAADDDLVNNGETDGGYHAAFSSLCDLTSSPGTYFGQTRTSKGNYFLVPYGRDYTSGGSAVTLDLDTHFGNMADTMGYLFGPSRMYRRNQGFDLTDAIVCQAPPALVNEASRQAGRDSVRFTRKIASELDAATRNKLVAVTGWTGVVLFNPNLPPIVLQPEALAPANTIRVFEPNAWEFIRMGGNRPHFVKSPGSGSMWHVRRDVTTGNLSMLLDAHGFVIEAPFCDQPRLCYTIQGVASSLA